MSRTRWKLSLRLENLTQHCLKLNILSLVVSLCIYLIVEGVTHALVSEPCKVARTEETVSQRSMCRLLWMHLFWQLSKVAAQSVIILELPAGEQAILM